MPRSPEFDPDDALDTAMKQFWLHGYADTTVDDLVKATGVSRYGLYGTFGGKRELFMKALDHYRDDLVTYQLGGLESEGATWSDIQTYFGDLVNLAETPEGQAGCFMCNTATEVAPHDPDVDKKVGLHVSRLRHAFLKALENTRRADDLDFDTEAFADTLVGVTQGVFALSRSPENLGIIGNFVKSVVKRPG